MLKSLKMFIYIVFVLSVLSTYHMAQAQDGPTLEETIQYIVDKLTPLPTEITQNHGPYDSWIRTTRKVLIPRPKITSDTSLVIQRQKETKISKNGEARIVKMKAVIDVLKAKHINATIEMSIDKNKGTNKAYQITLSITPGRYYERYTHEHGNYITKRQYSSCKCEQTPADVMKKSKAKKVREEINFRFYKKEKAEKIKKALHHLIILCGGREQKELF